MPSKRNPSTLELGSPGLKQYGGRIDEELLPRLRGTKAARVFEEMRANDSTIGAVFYTIEAALRQTKFRAEGPDETETEFLQSCMNDMDQTWDETISDILSMLVYGHSLHEIVYKVRIGPTEANPRYRSAATDHRFGWRGLFLRSQTSIDRWDIEPEYGTIRGCWQHPPGSLVVERYLPMDRCLLFRTETKKNNPEGRSILRNAYRDWFFKKRLEEIEAIGISRDMTGLPVVKVPAQIMNPNATPAQKLIRYQMETLVSQIDNNERKGIVFPAEENDGKKTGYSLELLTSNGTKQIPADPVIRRKDARIAMSMAAEFLLLGTEKQGSFALGAEKSSNFMRSLGWYIDVIVETLQKAVTKLYDVNGVPQEKRAKIVAAEINAPGLQEYGLFLQQAVAAGFLHPTPEDELKVREIAHLPSDLDDITEAFEEAKAIEEEQRTLDAEVARAGAEAKANPPPANASAAAAGSASASTAKPKPKPKAKK